MTETPSNSNQSEENFVSYRELIIAAAICGLWFMLASISTMPGFFLKMDPTGEAAQSLNHSVRLVGGLLIVFGLLPVLLKKFYPTYQTFLRASGIMYPIEKHHQTTLIAFLVVAGGLLINDLARNGVTGLAEFHAAQGIPTLGLAAFTSLQAAIIEELIFRGISFSILKKRYPVWVAILLPAILFGFAHVWWGLGRVAFTAMMGMFFALLRWRTDNLWGPMAMHFLINFGYPIPAWAGWLLAVLISAGLGVVNRSQKDNSPA
jgi:membrane protease YdiL (CAAX protease family)